MCWAGKRFSVEMRFSFPAVLSLLLCTDKEGTALLCLLSCMLHELGHIAVMLLMKRPPRKMVFYGGGILLSTRGQAPVPILLGGCAANFLLFGIFFLFEKTLLFGILNLFTGLLNLVPIRPLDGGMLLERAFLRILPAQRVALAMNICEGIAGALLIPLVIFLFLNGTVGVSAIVFLVYLLGVEMIEDQ